MPRDCRGRAAKSPSEAALNRPSRGRVRPRESVLRERQRAHERRDHAHRVNRRTDVVVKAGMRVEDFALHPNGVTVRLRQGVHCSEARGIALVAADGLWSRMRRHVIQDGAPRFRGRKAWRALLDAEHVRDEFREPVIRLWLGDNAHLVHYPVSAGRKSNVVAIVDDKS